MMERAQLAQVMEESKREAMERGHVPDNLTYEVGGGLSQELLELTEKAGKVSKGLSQD